jgi:hypothetical protein
VAAVRHVALIWQWRWDLRGKSSKPFAASERLMISMVQQAQAEGITQKQVITRALAAAGLPVDDLDLADRTSRRRRAAA